MDARSEDAAGRKGRKRHVAIWFSRVSRFHPFGFFVVILGCTLCILSRGSDKWQVWEVEDVPGVHRVTVGIWRACFHRKTLEGTYVKLHCREFSQFDGCVPRGILLAQVLMSSSAITGAVGTCLMSYSLWSAPSKKHQRNVLFPLSNVGVLLNVTSGVTTLIPMTWNLLSVLTKKGVWLPKCLEVAHVPKEQRIDSAVYMGFISAALQLLAGALILWDKSRRSNKIHPLDSVIVDPEPFRRDFTNCLPWESLLDIKNLSATLAAESSVSVTSPACSSSLRLPSPPLFSPPPNSPLIPPSSDPPLHPPLHLTRSSSSPTLFSSSLPCGSLLSFANLSVSSSRVPTELPPKSPPPCSPLRLPTLRPPSPTQRDFSSSPPPHSPASLPPIDI